MSRALLGCVGRRIVAKAPVLRELAGAEEVIRLIAALPPAIGALLAALLVHVCALLELLLAGIRASIAAGRPRIGWAVEAVLVNVQLEGVLAPVAVHVIAADNGQIDATDGLAWSIAVLGVCGLRADVGGRRRALAGLRRGVRELGCCAGRAGNDSGGRLERTDSLAGVAAPEVDLGALVVLAR